MTQHPNIHLVEVRCSTCATSFHTRSTAEAISVDVCSNCHPAYTGQTRTVPWNYRTHDGVEHPHRKADTTWALGYAEVAPNRWVKQWVVKSIVCTSWTRVWRV